MPFSDVMKKFKDNNLYSGSSNGPKVKNKKQATAIMMSEKKKADEGDTEYMSPSMKMGMKSGMKKKKGINMSPSKKFMLNKKLMTN